MDESAWGKKQKDWPEGGIGLSKSPTSWEGAENLSRPTSEPVRELGWDTPGGVWLWDFVVCLLTALLPLAAGVSLRKV